MKKEECLIFHQILSTNFVRKRIEFNLENFVFGYWSLKGHEITQTVYGHRFPPAVINSKPAGASIARGQNKNSNTVVKNK